MELRPTDVLIFGNPKAGTPLMQIVQTIGIDLPPKAVVWQDDSGKTWVAYNDPTWIAARRGVDDGHASIVRSTAAGLSAIVSEAVGWRRLRVCLLAAGSPVPDENPMIRGIW